MFDSEQYTTARDLATLTQYAVDNVPYFETIATTYSYHPSVPNDQNHENYASWYWTHSNIMMNSESEYFYPGAKGIKTANLEQIGRNIVVMASKDSKNYLAVLLNARFDDGEGNMTFYHIDDATAMFDWAFKHFSYKTILAESTEVGSLPVTLADGNDFVIARPKEEFKLFWYDGVDESLIRKEPENIVWYKDSLQAPVKKGEPLGVLTLEYNGEKLGEVEVVAVSDVKRSTVKYNLYAVKMFPKSKWLKKSLLIACIPCALYILICIYSFIVFRSKAKPIKPVYAVPKVEKKKRKKKQ
jgi:D-alanyl-D-alanine carboxypeptidase (penicillin-binding protein 5/6)